MVAPECRLNDDTGDMAEARSRRTRWCALTIVGLVTALLCVGVVAVFVDTPAAPLGLTASVAMTLGLFAAILLGIGMARLILRKDR